jgi:hypothetical protein
LICQKDTATTVSQNTLITPTKDLILVTAVDANSPIALFMIQSNLIVLTVLNASHNTKHINSPIWAIIVKIVDCKMLLNLAWYNLM